MARLSPWYWKYYRCNLFTIYKILLGQDDHFFLSQVKFLASQAVHPGFDSQEDWPPSDSWNPGLSYISAVNNGGLRIIQRSPTLCCSPNLVVHDVADLGLSVLTPEIIPANSQWGGLDLGLQRLGLCGPILHIKLYKGRNRIRKICHSKKPCHWNGSAVRNWWKSSLGYSYQQGQWEGSARGQAPCQWWDLLGASCNLIYLNIYFIEIKVMNTRSQQFTWHVRGSAWKNTKQLSKLVSSGGRCQKLKRYLN